MAYKTQLQKICCPTHPDDIVIRVDLNPKQEKLFYCHDCLSDYQGPELTKFQDILKVLETQYNNNSLDVAQVALPVEMKNFSKKREDMQRDLGDQIAEEKQKVYEEAKKMEVHMIEMFNMIKTAMHTHFDSFKENFNKTFEEYEQSIVFIKQCGSNISKEQSEPENMHKRIFTSSDTKEIEKNLRDVLNEINMYKEVNSVQGVEQIITKKSVLEDAVRNSSLTESKGLNYYAEKLRIYQSYLEAVLVGFKENKDKDLARDKDQAFKFERGCNDLALVLENLIKQVDDSNVGINKLLSKRFELAVAEKRECLITEKGLKPTLSMAYNCRTCLEKYKDISEDDHICEACKDTCHKGHNLEFIGTQSFTCQCQFKMRVCKLAVCCSYKLTGKRSIYQVTWKCNTDSMRSGNFVCSYCLENCHKGHNAVFDGLDSGFCNCSLLFSFCHLNMNK